MKRILVTGGAGFIGSHLVERLLADGHRVDVIDNCSTGQLANLAAVAGDPRLTVIEGTVSGCPRLRELATGADFIFHLAAAVGVELVVNSPIATIHTNLQETENLLEAALAGQTPTLVASTSEVYGKSNQPEFRESDDLLIGPPHLGRWSYACSKLMDEFMAMAYHRERGLPVTITRFFNTVGPRQTGRFGMVLPRFIQAAQSGRPLVIHGDGRQSRCFCHVRDTVEALFRLMNTPAALGEVVNVGSTEEVTIHELARLVVGELVSSSPIDFIPYEQAYAAGFEDMQRRKPSVDKLERLTGFRPATTLREIIQSTAAA